MNLNFFYYNPNIYSDEKVHLGLINYIQRLTPNITIQDKIFMEFAKYKDGLSTLCTNLDIRNGKLRAMTNWWAINGLSTLILI